MSGFGIMFDPMKIPESVKTSVGEAFQSFRYKELPRSLVFIWKSPFLDKTIIKLQKILFFSCLKYDFLNTIGNIVYEVNILRNFRFAGVYRDLRFIGQLIFKYDRSVLKDMDRWIYNPNYVEENMTPMISAIRSYLKFEKGRVHEGTRAEQER